MTEKFGCAYVIGPESAKIAIASSVVKIGCCVDLRRHLDELQRANWQRLRVLDSCFFPDLRLAKRVVARAHKIVSASRITGEWFELTAREAAKELRIAAGALNIPVMEQNHA